MSHLWSLRCTSKDTCIANARRASEISSSRRNLLGQLAGRGQDECNRSITRFKVRLVVDVYDGW